MALRRTDLPQFTVSSIEQGEQDDDGYIAWILRGELSRTQNIPVDTWCFLLLPGQTCLTGYFTLSSEKSGVACFEASEKKKPDVVGITLAQLGSYWRPYHIWMVEDGPEAWSEQVFSASDAIEETFTAQDGTALRRLAKASITSPDHSSARVVPGGWDHEHCALCNVHIDPGDRFFYSLEHREFLCVACYVRYVPESDIGFACE